MSLAIRLSELVTSKTGKYKITRRMRTNGLRILSIIAKVIKKLMKKATKMKRVPNAQKKDSKKFMLISSSYYINLQLLMCQT